jgi:CRISPR-associated protein Cpf1
MPENADANGAYNIARKGLMIIEQIKQSDDCAKVKLDISNKRWLQSAQGVSSVSLDTK